MIGYWLISLITDSSSLASKIDNKVLMATKPKRKESKNVIKEVKKNTTENKGNRLCFYIRFVYIFSLVLCCRSDQRTLPHQCFWSTEKRKLLNVLMVCKLFKTTTTTAF